MTNAITAKKKHVLKKDEIVLSITLTKRKKIIDFPFIVLVKKYRTVKC